MPADRLIQRLSLCLLVSLLPRCAQEVDPTPGAGVVYVAPLGIRSDVEARRAAWVLADLLGRPVRVLPARALTERGEVGPRDAGPLLDSLLRDAPPDAWRVVGVLDVPLTAPGYEYVIGFARQGERALLYTTDRLEAGTEAAHRRRIRQILRHELGHTYGAHHCGARCVMRHTVTDIDVLPEGYCRHHAALARGAEQQGVDDLTFLVRVARERMRLAQWKQAIATWQRALIRRPFDVRLQTSLGVALMARGEVEAAADAFERAQRANPRSPQPYYAQAVLFGAGLAPGRAGAFLEAAVTRDADGPRAHRAAGIFYQDLLEAPELAIRHFEMHIRLGGRDPEVIARLVALLS